MRRLKPGQRVGQASIPLLIAAVLLVTTIFGVSSVLRYCTFHAATFDLGIMTQVVWNTSQGRWFETSIDRATNEALIGSYLGNHVRPFLILLAPLYRLWPDPRLLLVLQAAALGVAAFPLCAIVVSKTGDRLGGLIISCCYLAYPALGFLNLVDFHPVAFTIPAILVAYWALMEERRLLFLGMVLLALSTKEEMVVPIGSWGLVLLLQPDRRRIGVGLVALAALWAAVCFGVVIPLHNEGEPYRFWQLWSQLPGLSGSETVQGGTAQSVGGGSAATMALFLVHLFLPLGFLPFFGPSSLVVALPSLIYLLLGERPAFHSVGYQYPAVLIPWFFLAVAEGLPRARRRSAGVGSVRLYRLGLAFLLIGSIGANVPLNPILLNARVGSFSPEPSHAQVEAALDLIPPGSGVATINRLGPPLVNRRVLVAFEYPAPFRLDHVRMADYVLLDLVDCRLVPAPDPRAEYTDVVMQVLQSGDFQVRYWSGDRILLLEKGAPGDRLADVEAYVVDLAAQGRPCWP